MQRQNKIKDGIIAALEDYKETRELGKQHTRFIFGYTKTQKIEAANLLIEVLNSADNTKQNNIYHLIPSIDVLKQGTLGKIWDFFTIAMPETYQAIKELKELIAEQNRRASYQNNDGYDSDTAERIQNRCSKD